MLRRWLNLPPQLSWNALSTGTIAVLQLLTLMVLTRLISAADFGLMALAQTCLALAFFLIDGGLSNAILVEKNFTRTQLRTFWQFNLAIGAVCTLVLWSAKSTLAWALGSAELPALVPWVCGSILASAAGSIHKSVLRSRMEFRTLALIELSAFTAGTALTLFAAWQGWGVYALLAGNLLTAVLGSGCAGAAARQHIALWGPPDWPTLRQWAGFGAWQVSDRFVTFVHSRADIILITKFLGIESAGVFDVLKQLAARPNNLLSASFGPVYMSLMGGRQATEALTPIYADLLRRSTLLTLPLYAGIAAAAPLLCRWVLGPDWVVHSPLLQVLALYFMLRSTGMFAMLGSLAHGVGHIGVLWNSAHAIVALIALTVALPYGLWGVCIALLCVQLLLFYPNYYFLIRPYLALSFGAYCWLMVRGVGLGLGVSIVALLFKICRQLIAFSVDYNL
jgi:O-antigen/teichoic acid export membrane protein